jgi:hypothetical protein
VTGAVAYPIDLHTHSLWSDGALAPAELVRRAAERGVRIQALSDHDTLLGVTEAVAEGERLGIRVIPATELNTESEWGDVHILGFFLDPHDEALEARLAWLRENRGRRIGLMVERLATIGFPVSLERVMAIAQGGAVGRPHLAQALFEAGYIPTYDDAFRTLLAKDSPAYVARVGLTPHEAVRLVRDHGGVPALAHPGTAVDLDAVLPQLVDAGLAGIECYYASHRADAAVRYLALASRYGLVPTGGSDFHGRGAHGAPLGGLWMPPGTVDALEARRSNAAHADAAPYFEPVEGSN